MIPSRRPAALALAMALALVGTLAACTGDDDPVPAATTASATDQPSTPATEAASVLPSDGPAPSATPTGDPDPTPGATPVVVDPSPTAGLDPLTTPGPAPSGLEIVQPDDPTGAPTVVLVHGGAWMAGSPDSLQDLAVALAEDGAIAVNLGYSTLIQGGGYPRTFDELACGIRQARAIGTQLGGSGELVLVGHSAGAHLAMVVALDETPWGADCPFSGLATPDRFVGLAGFYDIDAVAPVMNGFLGGTREQLPAVWDAADPSSLVTGGAPGVGEFPSHFFVGDLDTVAPIAISQALADDLDDAGADVEVTSVPGVDHFTIMRGDVSADLVLQD